MRTAPFDVSKHQRSFSSFKNIEMNWKNHRDDFHISSGSFFRNTGMSILN